MTGQIQIQAFCAQLLCVCMKGDADWITCCTVMEVDEMGYLCAARGC